MLLSPGAAHAQGVNYYCPTTTPSNPGQRYFDPGESCPGGLHTVLNMTSFESVNGDGPNHATGAKQYSNGSGANILDFGYGTSRYVFSQCASNRQGYPKYINQSGTPHYYRGRAFWGSSAYWCG
jgi:hypothetical protein